MLTTSFFRAGCGALTVASRHLSPAQGSTSHGESRETVAFVALHDADGNSLDQFPEELSVTHAV